MVQLATDSSSRQGEPLIPQVREWEFNCFGDLVYI